MNQTAETIQDAMHRQGLKTYEELQQDVKRLELHLDIENVNKKLAQRLADKYEYRAKVWRTIAIAVIAATVAWRIFVFYF